MLVVMPFIVAGYWAHSAVRDQQCDLLFDSSEALRPCAQSGRNSIDNTVQTADSHCTQCCVISSQLVLTNILRAISAQVSRQLRPSNEWFVVSVWVKPFTVEDAHTLIIYNTPQYGMVRHRVAWDQKGRSELEGCHVNGLVEMTEGHSEEYFPYDNLNAESRSILLEGVSCSISLNRPSSYTDRPVFSIEQTHTARQQ
jgi:hypothetical protein